MPRNENDEALEKEVLKTLFKGHTVVEFEDPLYKTGLYTTERLRKMCAVCGAFAALGDSADAKNICPHPNSPMARGQKTAYWIAEERLRAARKAAGIPFNDGE